MRKMSFRTRLWLLILLTALLIGLTTFAVGKYITTVSVKSSVTFTATLAEKVLLQEHEAKRQADGSYQLDDTSIVQANTYTLIPGLDVPKDPHIVIIGKTEIPAYLYIEVVDSLDEDSDGNKPVTYTVNENWLLLNDLAGKNGGAVYVYSGNETEPKQLDETFTASEVNLTVSIPVLNDDKVFVSQHLLHQSVADGNDVLTIYAFMAEISLSNNADTTAQAKEIYQTIHGLS